MEMLDLWNLVIDNFYGFLVVLFRVIGIFAYNPIFSRSNVPQTLKTSMSLLIAITFLISFGGKIGYVPVNLFDFAGTLIKETALGLTFGFFVNLLMSSMVLAGELADNQIGMTMARTMDPSTGIQMPVFSNMYFYMFVLYFFVTGGHLEYIRLFRLSYDIMPVGFDFTMNTLKLAHNIVMFMGTAMVLACKLAMPIIAAELIVEFCVGIIMKAVPTIQVFVINIQLKIVVGMFVMLAIAKPICDFIDMLIGTMWNNLDVILKSFI
ncbi:hypothetical protein FACS189499_01750 [Clostridia bacterium]|nr:hypothetical protein FACS189499_01750 [Clostridia bacterium]